MGAGGPGIMTEFSTWDYIWDYIWDYTWDFEIGAYCASGVFLLLVPWVFVSANSPRRFPLRHMCR